MKNKTKKYRLEKTTVEVMEIEVNQTEFFEDWDTSNQTEEEMIETLESWFYDGELDYDMNGDYGIEVTNVEAVIPTVKVIKL